jgi:hypothetical protein
VYSDHGANSSSVYMVPYCLPLNRHRRHIKARGTGEKADCFFSVYLQRFTSNFSLYWNIYDPAGLFTSYSRFCRRLSLLVLALS